MFAPVSRIAGAERLYHVTDRVTAHQALELVRQKSPPSPVFNLQWRDLARLDPEKTVLAVNPSGRQIHVALTTLGGCAATLMVHLPSNSVDLIPMRFSRTRHDSATVLQCTLNTAEKLLVVNDVCSEEDRDVADRLRDVHQLVHSDHVPDAALFPLRLVARKTFSLAQTTDLKRFIERPGAKCHSVSLVGNSCAGRELRILMTTGGTAPGAEGRSGPRHRASKAAAEKPGRLSVGSLRSAQIVAAQGPDSYKLYLGQKAEGDWQFLSVKSIEESKMLSSADLSSPRPCQVAWDGAAWRISSIPAHHGHKSEIDPVKP